MKKRENLLITAAVGLLLFIFGIMPNLQAELVQIPNTPGTLNNSSGISSSYDYGLPFNYWYARGWSKTLFTQDELEDAGVEEGLINSIALFCLTEGVRNNKWGTVSIWLENTDMTVMDVDEDGPDANAVKIYEDGDANSSTGYELPTNIVDSWITFPCTQQFEYTGGGLIVYVCYYGTSYGGSNYGFRCTSYLTPHSYMKSDDSYTSDACGATKPSYTNELRNWRFDMQLDIDMNKMKYLRTEVEMPSVTKISETRYSILQANVVTEKQKEPVNVSRMTINTNGTSPASVVKINSMKLYYTGSTSSFDGDGGLLVSTINNPNLATNSVFTFNLSLPQSLNEGNNYFWVTYEVDIAETYCDAELDATLSSCIVSGDTKIPADGETKGKVFVNYAPISMGDIQTGYILCSSVAEKDIAVFATGAIRSYKWDRWNYQTNSWESYTEESLINNITVATNDILSGYDLYRVTIFPPLGDCGLDIIQSEINFTISNDITEVTSRVVDENLLPDENGVYMLSGGSELNIAAEVTGDVKEYIWQYTQDGLYWFDFSLLDQPTANTPNFNFIADEALDSVQIRMRVISEDACGTSMYTEPINAKIYKTPAFVLQPPKVASLCPGEDFYVSLNFYGEEPISQRWYKDGYPLTSEVDTIYTRQELEFTNVTPETAGKYYYEILVPTNIGNVMMVSDTLSLYVLPETELVTITKGNVKASEGGVAVLQVEASYAITNLDEPNGKFQWYRYNAITLQSTPLVNSYRIKGATSSVLSISYINSSDYTYNGDYYYCVVEGRCNGSQVATSEQIILIPEQEVKIIKNPVDVVACPKDKQVVLEVQAFSENTSALIYQWFYDNTEITNDSIFDGANTRKLTINIDNTTDFTDDFYCQVWLNGSSFVAQSESVTVTVLEDYTPEIVSTNPPADNTIIGTVGEELVLTVETANPATDIITWMKFNSATSKYESINNTGNVLNIAELALADSGTYTIVINTGCGTFEMKDEVTWTVEVVEPEIDDANSESSIIDSITLFDLNIAPNPATDKLTISYNSSAQDLSTIQILDLRGTVIASFESNTKTGTNYYNINLEKYNLSAGGYFVKLSSGKNNVTKSFIITK